MCRGLLPAYGCQCHHGTCLHTCEWFGVRCGSLAKAGVLSLASLLGVSSCQLGMFVAAAAAAAAAACQYMSPKELHGAVPFCLTSGLPPVPLLCLQYLLPHPAWPCPHDRRGSGLR
jgi:hypothetical protein